MRIVQCARELTCPHCGIAFHDNPAEMPLSKDADGDWFMLSRVCPKCKRLILQFAVGNTSVVGGAIVSFQASRIWFAHPRGMTRAPVPESVTPELASDYREAALVLADSAKASAALSRRTLQHLLREHAKVRPSDLDKEIQEMLDRGTLPSHLADSLDAVRVVGNFAAHPIKSKSTGEVVDVEPGEAEANLDTLESLFDFYFEAPRKAKQRRDALNKKLAAAGKPELK
jgi:hypothetical protein